MHCYRFTGSKSVERARNFQYENISLELVMVEILDIKSNWRIYELVCERTLKLYFNQKRKITVLD